MATKDQSSQPAPSLDPEYPEFKSALPYSEVRDFAYPDFHPLYYGVPRAASESMIESEDLEDDDDDGIRQDQQLADGPPWQEDPDLTSPVVTSHEHGDRISKEYEFSVASADEIHGRAVALFDFTPENDNEAPLREGQIIWVSYRHGQGWLVAEDPESGETGLVPEEYVQLISMTSNHEPDNAVGEVCLSPEADSEGWVDENYEEEEAVSDEHENETKQQVIEGNANETEVDKVYDKLKDLNVKE
jgi:hypothetical protein